MLALTQVGGAFDVALATAEAIALVMAEMNALSAEGGIMGIVPLFTSSFSSTGVAHVGVGMIQPS